MGLHEGLFDAYRFKDRSAVERFWRWEYLENPCVPDGRPFIWLCRVRGRIAGHFCVMPVNLSIGGRPFKGGWCQDLAMRPEFRNTGAGYFFVRHVLDDLKGLLDAAMVAGTNRDSYLLFKTLGFTDMGYIGRNVSIAAFSAFSRRAGGRRNGVPAINEFADTDESFDGLCRGLSARFGCVASRDAAALRWRFVSQPYWKYRIFASGGSGGPEGYIVVKDGVMRKGPAKMVRVGVISDIFFDPAQKETLAALLRAAADHFMGKADIIRCDILNSDANASLRKNGFFRVAPKNRFLVYPLNPGAEEGRMSPVLNDVGKWYLTYADSDMDLS